MTYKPDGYHFDYHEYKNRMAIENQPFTTGETVFMVLLFSGLAGICLGGLGAFIYGVYWLVNWCFA